MSIQQQLRKQTKPWRENVCQVEIIIMIMIHHSCLISTDKIIRLKARKYACDRQSMQYTKGKRITLIQASKRVSFC